MNKSDLKELNGHSLSFHMPTEITEKVVINSKDFTVQITPSNSKIPMVLFTIGIDENEREFICFQNAKYYKEQNHDK